MFTNWTQISILDFQAGGIVYRDGDSESEIGGFGGIGFLP
jgi:hypothetical protein